MIIDSIHHSMGRSFHLEQTHNSLQYRQKTKVECIRLVHKSFLECSWDTPWTRWEDGLVIYWWEIREMSEQCHHLKFQWTDSNQKRCTFKNRDNEFQEHSSEENEEASDPNPCVEGRQDVWSIMRDYMYRNHVAPRTKLCVPKDGFPIPLNYIDVQRQTKTSIDVLHEATIHDYWNIDRQVSVWTLVGVTRFELLNKKSSRRTHVGSKQTDTETGHCKTWTSLAGRVVKHVEKTLSAKPQTHGQKKNPNWTQRESNKACTLVRTMSLVMKKSWTRPEDNARWGEPQRCLAKSPHQPTRTVQVGSDSCGWLVSNSNESKIMRTWSLNRKEFARQRVSEQKRLGPRSRLHVAPHLGAQQANFHIWSSGHSRNRLQWTETEVSGEWNNYFHVVWWFTH